MAIKKTEAINYQNIADAIRIKNGQETLYEPSKMAAAIKDIYEPDIIYQGVSSASAVWTLKDNVNLKYNSNQAFQCVTANGAAIAFNPAAYNNFAIVAKVKVLQLISGTTRMIFGAASSYASPPLPQMYLSGAGKLCLDCIDANNSYFSGGVTESPVEINTVYYFVARLVDNALRLYVLDENYNIVISTSAVSVSSWKANSSLGMGFGGAENNSSYFAKYIEIYPNKCFVMADNSALWGVINQNVIDAVS